MITLLLAACSDGALLLALHPLGLALLSIVLVLLPIRRPTWLRQFRRFGDSGWRDGLRKIDVLVWFAFPIAILAAERILSIVLRLTNLLCIFSARLLSGLRRFEFDWHGGCSIVFGNL